MPNVTSNINKINLEKLNKTQSASAINEKLSGKCQVKCIDDNASLHINEKNDRKV